jgi:hypothetical protein
MSNKDTIIEALTIQLKIEREGNLALVRRIAELEKPMYVDSSRFSKGPSDHKPGMVITEPVHAIPVIHAVRCTYPQCQATNGCVGACSKGQPDLARVGEVGVWGEKREWVGLTDEEVHDAFNFVEFVKQVSFDRDRPEWCENFAAYIEAKLKEKNT